jgi:[acyl-carrier-protein] S-malonyltransferase
MTAMQLAVAEELVAAGIHPDHVVGYSIGEVACALHAGAATFEDLVAFARELPTPTTTGDGKTVVAAAKTRRTVDAALAALGTCTHSSRLSDRVVAIPTSKADEAHVRTVLAAHGFRMFDLAPCALHGPTQQPFADRLLQQLLRANVRAPTIPMLSSQTLRAIATADDVRRELAANVATPFHFADVVRRLHGDHGITRFVNIGPGEHARHFVLHSGLDVEAGNAIDLLATARRT